MSRKHSLANDLSLVVNNPQYSDVRIICKDDVLYGCRTILAARSEVLDQMLFNDVGQAPLNEIFFPKIDASVMKVILMFLYTGRFSKSELETTDLVELYYAANYLALPELQDEILRFTKEYLKQCSAPLTADLFARAVDKIPMTNDNDLLSLLTIHLATTPLYSIPFHCFATEHLSVFLSETRHSDEYFATTEYELFCYIILWAANRISPEALSIFESRFPPPEIAVQQTLYPDEPIESYYDVASFQEYKAYILQTISPIIPFIDFSLIHPNILANVIHPLGLIPPSVLLEAYKYQTGHKTSSADRRGGASCKIEDLRWDKLACGPNLEVKDYGTRVVSSKNSQSVESVRAVNPFRGKGMYDWDVVVEEKSRCAWIGVCAKGVDFSSYLGKQDKIYVFSSDGQIWSSGKAKQYATPFGKGATITVHLDMTNRTCAFSVDGIRYPPAFVNLPDEMYPAAAIWKNGKLRIKHKA